MISQPAEWWTLTEGMYLRDANGKTWRIVAKRFRDGAHEAVIVDPEGYRTIIALPPDKVVDLMVPTEVEVIWLVQQVFPGATVVAVEDPPSGRDTKTKRMKLTNHLIWMHGLGMSPYSDVSNGSLANLLEIHTLESARPWEAAIPHAHFPELRLRDGSLRGLGFGRPPLGTGYTLRMIDPDKEMAS